MMSYVVFGILAARFRVFHTSINMKLENINKGVMECCVLHNFLRRNLRGYYPPVTCIDVEDLEAGDTIGTDKLIIKLFFKKKSSVLFMVSKIL